MKISELINILRSYDPELEFMIASEDDLWSIDQPSFREATLYETSKDYILDSQEYNPAEDGTIMEERNALLIDLDI